MQKIILLALGTILGALLRRAIQKPARQSPDSLRNKQVEKELMRLEHEWLEALKRQDAGALDVIQAEEFIYMVGEGRFGNKADARAALSEFLLESIKSEIVTARVYGDTAVLALRGNMKGVFRGQDTSGDYLETAVWVKRNGRWQVVAAHLTRTGKNQH